MSKLILNIVALSVFVVVFVFEFPVETKKKGSAVLKTGEREIEVPVFEKKKKKFSEKIVKKHELKRQMEERLQKALHLSDKIERKKQSSVLKKELKDLVASWGNEKEDVLWLQDMIGRYIRPMKY
jgi:hypothetical protein